MENYTKKEVIELLKEDISALYRTQIKQRVADARLSEYVVAIAEKLKLDNYKNVRGCEVLNLNLGDIIENQMLYLRHLVAETEKFEVKALIKNAPNVLTNESVKWVYVVVIKSSMKGVYKVKASEVLNKRIVLSTLQECESLQRIESLSARLGLNE